MERLVLCACVGPSGTLLHPGGVHLVRGADAREHLFGHLFADFGAAGTPGSFQIFLEVGVLRPHSNGASGPLDIEHGVTDARNIKYVLLYIFITTLRVNVHKSHFPCIFIFLLAFAFVSSPSGNYPYLVDGSVV